MKVLVIDEGGTNVKLLLSEEEIPRKFESGPKLTAEPMVACLFRENHERRRDAGPWEPPQRKNALSGSGYGTRHGACRGGGTVEPMELGHLPDKKGTYEDYVGKRSLEKHVCDVVEKMTKALEPNEVVLGGRVCRSSSGCSGTPLDFWKGFFFGPGKFFTQVFSSCISRIFMAVPR